MRRAGLALAVVAVAGAVVPLSTHGAVPAVAPAVGAGVFDIDSLLTVCPLAADQDVRSDLIAADSTSSIHLTQVAQAISGQRHRRHDLTMSVIRGAGQLRLGGETRRVKAGQIIRIPRNTTYALHNLGSVPMVLTVIFTPAFDGKDLLYDTPDARQGEPAK